jgi:hypothetical protein
MATETKSGDQLASFFRKAATTIEKLQVQLALGEAEADDKYEELKKKFTRYINGVKAQIGTRSRKAANDLHADLDDLQVQLALGKAESKETFESQRKKILRALTNVENKVKSAYRASGFEEELLHEIEATRIKLDLIKVHYELGKMEARDEFEDGKHDLEEMIAKAKAKIAASKDRYSAARQRRHAEMKEAYKHARKAFVKA